MADIGHNLSEIQIGGTAPFLEEHDNPLHPIDVDHIVGEIELVESGILTMGQGTGQGSGTLTAQPTLC